MADVRAIAPARIVAGIADLCRRHAGDEETQRTARLSARLRAEILLDGTVQVGQTRRARASADIRGSAPVASDLAVIVDDWTFQGDDAQKTIETACAGF